MEASFVLNPSSGGRPTPIGPQGIRIGRAPDNDLVLNDANVSREHALLKVEGPSLVLVDLGSRNGCVVNGKRAGQRTVLNLGDELRIGPFTWRVGRAAPEAAAPAWTAAKPQRQPQKSSNRTLLYAIGAGIAVLAIAVAAYFAFLKPRGLITDSEAQRRALAGAVFLYNPETESTGSGSVVDANGLVLTNYHVIEISDSGDVAPAVAVFVSSNGDPSSAPPTKTYLARPVRWDSELDLAIVQIVSDQSGQPLPRTVKFTPVVVGDSSTLRTNDRIKVFGFPSMGFDPNDSSLGGITATLTEGVVSGYLNQGVFSQAWIKTDAEINHGNSGGLALDSHWRLIGIPTAMFGKAEQDDMGKIGWIRPVNMATDMIRMASDTLYGKSK